MRAIYDGAGVKGLGDDWWPEDASSMDMAWQFFISRMPGSSPVVGFSEAKLREIFPGMFGQQGGPNDGYARPLAKNAAGHVTGSAGAVPCDPSVKSRL